MTIAFASVMGFLVGFLVATDAWERAIRRRGMDPNCFRRLLGRDTAWDERR